MKKVVNKNKSRLVFPKYDISIEPGEIKIVTEEQYNGMIQNISIELVLHKSLQKDKPLNIKKGRKRKIINH